MGAHRFQLLQSQHQISELISDSSESLCIVAASVARVSSVDCSISDEIFLKCLYFTRITHNRWKG